MASFSPRWNVIEKKDGITDVMRTEILAAIRTAIEMFGTAKKHDIAKDVAKYCMSKYFGYWTVTVSETGKADFYSTFFENCYLVVECNTTNLKFSVWKSSKSS